MKKHRRAQDVLGLLERQSLLQHISKGLIA